MNDNKRYVFGVAVFVMFTCLLFSGCLFSAGVSAEEIKESALYMMSSDEISSYLFDMDMTMSMTTESSGWPMSMDMTIAGDGAVDVENRQLSMKMQMTSSGMLAMETDLEMYLLDSTMYMYSNVLGESQWLKMDFYEFGGTWDSYDQLASQLDLLEIGEVERLDDESINGVDCYVLQITPDIQSLYEALLSQQSLGGSEYSTSVFDMDLTDMMSSFTVKCWIAKENDFMMKMYAAMTMDMSDEESTLNLEMELIMQFSNYNLPIYISLPEEAVDATDYSEMFSSSYEAGQITV